ncbi:hypothetical protein [Rossellomorea marisflavi]|uniref:hypothetical protein n=1 Tax=Rossellomorea marisflavi TaxID=189381 RepID=UPI003D2F24A8
MLCSIQVLVAVAVKNFVLIQEPAVAGKSLTKIPAVAVSAEASCNSIRVAVVATKVCAIQVEAWGISFNFHSKPCCVCSKAFSFEKIGDHQLGLHHHKYQLTFVESN